jgi:putative hydrolase of the HAD superfamily
MFDVIAFDADDTLWDNERLYHAAKQEFISLLSECSDPAYCAHRMDEIEVNNVQFYGYGIKSFVLSMIEAALVLTDHQAAAEKIASILGFAKRMLAADVQLIDGVAETLAALAPRYPLMLITKGDPSEQQRKIDESGLAGFFRWVEIVPDKTPRIYRAILERYQINPERFLMVGNSLRSDVLPVLQIGGQAALVHYANNWAHEMSVELGEYTYPSLNSLPELLTWIETRAV